MSAHPTGVPAMSDELKPLFRPCAADYLDAITEHPQQTTGKAHITKVVRRPSAPAPPATPTVT